MTTQPDRCICRKHSPQAQKTVLPPASFWYIPASSRWPYLTEPGKPHQPPVVLGSSRSCPAPEMLRAYRLGPARPLLHGVPWQLPLTWLQGKGGSGSSLLPGRRGGTPPHNTSTQRNGTINAFPTSPHPEPFPCPQAGEGFNHPGTHSLKLLKPTLADVASHLTGLWCFSQNFNFNILVQFLFF